MSKKSLSESDICDRFITPSLLKSAWDQSRWRREYAFTDGRIIVRGKLVARGKQKRADYLLFYKSNLPIAVIEAKDNNHSFTRHKVGIPTQCKIDMSCVLRLCSARRKQL